MTPAEQYPELDQFLGGYFHEDFAWYAPTWEGVVDFYAGETSLDRRRQALAELDELLRDSGDLVDEAFRQLGICYLTDPLPPREWLAAVRERLATSLPL